MRAGCRALGLQAHSRDLSGGGVIEPGSVQGILYQKKNDNSHLAHFYLHPLIFLQVHFILVFPSGGHVPFPLGGAKSLLLYSHGVPAGLLFHMRQ